MTNRSSSSGFLTSICHCSVVIGYLTENPCWAAKNFQVSSTGNLCGYCCAAAATQVFTAETQSVTKIVAPASRRHVCLDSQQDRLPAGRRRYIFLTSSGPAEEERENRTLCELRVSAV